MKIELDATDAGVNKISAYEPGYIAVAGTIFNSGIILTATDIETDKLPTHVSGLSLALIDTIIARSPELILFGTGAVIEYPDAELLNRLIAARIGFEVMDTGSACRSFNFLAGEGRDVVALIFLLPG